MDIQTFITNYREAFGQHAELPIVFWYSDIPVNRIEKVNGCFFKCFAQVRKGEAVSLNAENIGCGGGKLYTGFSEVPEFVPNFVSLKERYKQTPEMVRTFIEELGIPRCTNEQFLNFARLDLLENLEGTEGILFLATPDRLSGLTSWAFFDNNAQDAVTTIFGSGCSAIVTQAVVENRKGGRRTFIGLFDPSVRPYFEPDLLSFVIPLSRFREMYHTMRQSCLFDAHAWGKIRERMTT